jgi:hypothetical protein
VTTWAVLSSLLLAADSAYELAIEDTAAESGNAEMSLPVPS